MTPASSSTSKTAATASSVYTLPPEIVIQIENAAVAP